MGKLKSKKYREHTKGGGREEMRGKRRKVHIQRGRGDLKKKIGGAT